MSPLRSNDVSPSPNYAGLDYVRVLAMVMVVIQHTLSLADREELTVTLGLSIGQLGVAIFLVVSGLLSFESRRTPIDWLSQRLFRVYPAFWLAMLVSFVLASLSGYKNASLQQIGSQLLGTGLWTHSGELVNSPTWFVSLILACYYGTFLSRVLRCPGLLAAISSAVLSILVVRDSAPWLMSHFLTYAVSCTIATFASSTQRRAAVVVTAGILGSLALLIQPAFAYTALSLIIVELSLIAKTRPKAIKWAANYSYEFYLVHGVALAGALSVMKHSPVLAVVSALTSSAIAAVILNRMATFFVRQICPARSEKNSSPIPNAAIRTIPQT